MIALGGATLLAAAGLGLAASGSPPGAPEGASRGVPRKASAPRGGGGPNIVLIQSDDQTYGQLTRRTMPETYRLLGDRGTRFTDYLATTAQCCPSRASLLTGQYAHNHGVTANNIGYPGLVDKGNVLPVWLERAGYRTIHVGKYLNRYESYVKPNSIVAPGWDQWYSVLGATRYYGYDLYVNGGVRHYGSARTDHVTRVLNGRAVHMVKRYAPGRAFFLQLDQRAPHGQPQRDPYGRCIGAPIPEPGDQNLFRRTRLPKPPSFNELNVRDKPSFLSSTPKIGPVRRQKIQEQWRCVLASLRGVDRGVERIYDAVKDAGELSKTVFIFASDNGRLHGQHRLPAGKVLPYEEALHVPLMIRVPKRYRHGAPRVKKVGTPAGNIDLAPTILALTGAQPCSAPGDCRTMDGRSLLPLLRRPGAWRGRGLLTEYTAGGTGSGRSASCEFTGIRTRNNLYVRHLSLAKPGTKECIPADEYERYNLKRDPFELHNLCFGGSAGSCPNTDTQLDLEARLSQLQDCAGVAGRDEPVGGRPFCE
jgi:N-acetylglucosamine-6-sulfatase